MIVRHSTILISAIKFVTVLVLAGQPPALSNDLNLQLRSQRLIDHGGNADHAWVRATEQQAWVAAETAVIVCDVWDKHHCLNAVRRMEEFTPRMNEVLKEARRRGATIVHAPSDCMPAYVHHPARERAINIPHDRTTPDQAAFWSSRIPAEEAAAYPIDQSDGGDDDDPAEHAVWAAELTALGRNPAMPWKMQSSLIEIDSDHDFISDKGDEVWNILHSRRIKNVILVGVHTNMCVLGRPFGLRQMVRSGKNVVLMRDMTDCMYNPRSWPFVDHFTGNDLIVSHIERFVCPTITSDQFLGGLPFRSKFDTRGEVDIADAPVVTSKKQKYRLQWTTANPELAWREVTQGSIERPEVSIWFRCTVRLPGEWIANDITRLSVSDTTNEIAAWMNGTPLVRVSADPSSQLQVPAESIVADDINLLVIRRETAASSDYQMTPPALINGGKELPLKGRWQFRIGDDPAWANIPLPAKFGIGSDVLFEPR